ncbi:unnamed protein product [Prorocentrum cordatum]|uniref:CstA N-terminal domain-containing protein n=1 Tax=Prorocentrum cordatum TaxID=2364126 RepID=A0ABN9XTT1_9DINO|nr:unnamed protein product [Polarella glacialis]
MLQPRDFINSHQLKVCMALMVLGLLVRSPKLDAVAIRTDVDANAAPIFPTLFTTIACGSVSGFHSLVASGVTSKQLDKMRDARPIGYTAMLGESALAALVIVACCSSGTWASNYGSWPVNWAQGFTPGAALLLEEPRAGRNDLGRPWWWCSW